MGFEFLRRVRKTSIILSMVLFPVFSIYFGISFGVGWIIGVVWSVINIQVITNLVKRIFITSKRNYLRIALVFLIKFPVLYFLGYLILASARFPAAALLAGFVWPFFVMTMKALGRAFLGLDEPKGLCLKKNSTAN